MGTTDILSNYSLIVERIVNRSDLTEDTVKQRIGAKIQEYGGLLTEAGAAYSLAKELNVSLADDDYKAQALVQEARFSKVNELQEGMYGISVIARIDTKYETRHFNSNGRAGNVTNLFVADESGKAKVVMWNKEEQAQELHEGEGIEIKNGYTKKNMNGFLEVHCNEKTEVKNTALPAELEVGVDKISSLKHDDKNRTIEATVTEIYNPTLIDVCSQCRGINNKCGHNAPQSKSFVLNCSLNDGTGTIRGVLFRNKAEQFLNLEAIKYLENNGLLEESKRSVIGENFQFTGNVK